MKHVMKEGANKGSPVAKKLPSPQRIQKLLQKKMNKKMNKKNKTINSIDGKLLLE